MNDKLLCTQLAFSGGTGSGCIAEMIIHGDLEVPKNFVVIRANPGMENFETNEYCKDVEIRLKKLGIPYIETNVNLLEGLLNLKKTGKTRFDLPPFWTINPKTGQRARLLQRCTTYCKIRPMDKALRQWMHDNLGVNKLSKRLGEDTVCKWIGFSNDEWMRIKEPRQKYAYFEYPLINLKMTKQDIISYYLKKNIKLPSRSVCNACFANDISFFKKMHDERPDEFWNQAVAVDEEIRDLTCVGVKGPCFVSKTLIPLRELATNNFVYTGNINDDDDIGCHSGHCFI